MTTPYGPPYGGYPAGPPPAIGRLVVQSSYPATGFLFALTGVQVEINGQPSKVSWGEVPFDLPAGNYHLRVSGRWFGVFGAAELPVAVYPGQAVTVYYRTPAFKWMRGGIGFTPQQTPGRGWMVAINIVALLFVVYVIVSLATS
ncbi:hypothetical protein [Actinophytocola sp.]|uniref:hypothetical protein n=1 Tax=Actinophytocola sp. TaxID=1872138 RepID=UPI002ED4A083